MTKTTETPRVNSCVSAFSCRKDKKKKELMTDAGSFVIHSCAHAVALEGSKDLVAQFDLRLTNFAAAREKSIWRLVSYAFHQTLACSLMW